METLFNESQINDLIKQPNIDTNLISDGYHTFGELYEHRINLFIALCRASSRLIRKDYRSNPNMLNAGSGLNQVWRSKAHSDGSAWDGWFILGIGKGKGHQITYHLPMSKWEQCNDFSTLDKAPEWDGHTSNDVLDRILVFL